MEYTNSYSNTSRNSPTSYFPIKISKSTQRILCEAHSLQKLYAPDSSTSPAPNQASLKFIKLAPISTFQEINEKHCKNTKPRRKNKIQPIVPIKVIKKSVLTCSSLRKTGSDKNIENSVCQDELLLVSHLNNCKYQYVFGIFDGHGQLGHIISTLIRSRLLSLLPTCPQGTNESELASYCEALIHLTSKTVLHSPINSLYSGSTLNLVLLSGNLLICSNIGDSRAVLGRFSGRWQAESLSLDHKPSVETEAFRVRQCGGLVLRSKERTFTSNEVDDYANFDSYRPLRVWGPELDTPGLTMTRSIGDKGLKMYGVTDQPDVVCRKLKRKDKVLVVASDGLWDVVSNQEAVEIVGRELEKKDSPAACQKLAEEAVKRWKRIGEHVDDISVVVAFLHVKG
jgi:serine/threonine protein phosphatase PrpC